MDEQTVDAGERRTGPAALEAYLHEHIPLSRAMGVRVERADARAVILSAPFGPNINHRHTVFGGSVSALAILAGWALVHVRLGEDPAHHRIVIQRNRVEYLAPMEGRFRARAEAPPDDAWSRFLRMLERKDVGRVEVEVEVRGDGDGAGARLSGQYVALRGEPSAGAEVGGDGAPDPGEGGRAPGGARPPAPADRKAGP